MKHFPIFVALTGQRVVVSGAGECAVAKLRLILKTEARVEVYGTSPHTQITTWVNEGKLTHIPRPLRAGDARGARLFYAANDDAENDGQAAEHAMADGVLTNVVDNLGDSQFITPAIVDRDPVVVAIGTEGAAPVLARDIKRRVEEMLPTTLGSLTRIGQKFRARAEMLPMGRIRRAFWSAFYFKSGPEAFTRGAAEDALEDEFNRHLVAVTEGRVDLVGAGPGDPELLTLKARNLLHEADVVIHDALVPPAVLELARREAVIIEAGKRGFGPSWKQDDINDLLVDHARKGHHVVRLKSGDPGIFGRLEEEAQSLSSAGVPFAIVPGVTSASAAAASIGQPLTRRGQNSAVRLLTAHDMKGYAEADWRGLTAPGAVAAIYMGKKAARFLQGRMLMFGADRLTPVTVVENASQPSQRILPTTLMGLPDVTDGLEGPAIMLVGLAPRPAADALTQLTEDFA